MKRTPLALFSLALIAACVIALLPTQQPVSAKSDDENRKILIETMEVMAGNYRLIRRQIRDASKNADTADKLAEMTQAAIRAKDALPATATNDDLKVKYRVVMNDLIIVLTQAENAALQGDQAKLKEYVMAANTVKGEGHELFIADDE